ncbi:DUF1549 domain-containing protein [Planctomycetales bacterium ZRK34]|nr:DUF1549 domain-containing protein [Planctomycetales bacterium ZRK34]
MIRHAFTAALWIGMAGSFAGAADAPGQRVDFVRDIQPILTEHCVKCHGPRKQEGGIRWDRKASPFVAADSGHVPIVPGEADAGVMVKMITGEGEKRMPPAAEGKPLSPQSIDLIKRWIAQGADWPDGVDPTYDDLPRHWSFNPPKKPDLPPVQHAEQVRSPIDRFVLAKLESQGLSLSPRADRYTLIRRVSLDLTGLPPTPKQVDDFVNDQSPGAFERVVDRLLASPAYGERWARVWLDLARYADTQGYEKDNRRPGIWRYRDWLIKACNSDMPFDQFTIDQLAGDLLPNPTSDQLLATAFHRNTMTNTEGGTDDEEFRTAAVMDRIDTTGLVWMGLTVGCAKCHSHKYDPVTQREYYQLYAFFNQTADADRNDDSPRQTFPTSEQNRRISQLDEQIAALKDQLVTDTPELAAAMRQWSSQQLSRIDDVPRGRFVRVEIPGREAFLSLAEVQVFSGEKNIAPDGKATQSSTDYSGPAKLAIDNTTDGDYFNAKSTTHTKKEKATWWEVDLGQMHPIDRIVIHNRTDGGLHKRLHDFRITVLDADRRPLWHQNIKPAPNPDLALTPAALPPDVRTILTTAADQRTKSQHRTLLAYFIDTSPQFKPQRDQLAALEKERQAIKPPTVPIMQTLQADKRRVTHMLTKGNFLTPSDEVQADVPMAFNPWPADAPRNRLGLAKWLVARDNPLTARVQVNRYWARLFGLGLVETEEDFGTQGIAPSHPKLLDWLAVCYMDDCDWSAKKLLKTIVMSATYQQSSRITGELLDQDPRNVLLSRGPRFRISAEMVRDQSLASAGLLSEKMYGPSVMPPQPGDIWQVVYSGDKWATSKHDDRYRRGLYTFIRRTSPYPSMITFDGTSREVCTIRRIRTNTPLQALVTLNDPVYIEAAQALARRIVSEAAPTVDARIAYGFRLVLIRPPHRDEIARLTRLYETELAHYQSDESAARDMATSQLGPLPASMKPAELAAWTIVVHTLLNLDETITKG